MRQGRESRKRAINVRVALSSPQMRPFVASAAGPASVKGMHSLTTCAQLARSRLASAWGLARSLAPPIWTTNGPSMISSSAPRGVRINESCHRQASPLVSMSEYERRRRHVTGSAQMVPAARIPSAPSSIHQAASALMAVAAPTLPAICCILMIMFGLAQPQEALRLQLL